MKMNKKEIKDVTEEVKRTGTFADIDNTVLKNSQQFKSPLSSENGKNYNQTYEERGVIAVGMSRIPDDRWPLKLKTETQEEYEIRMKIIKGETK